MMKRIPSLIASRTARNYLALVILSTLWPSMHLTAQTSTGAQETPAVSERDGQRDFDFETGRWKVHNRRLLHPLTGSNEWVEFEGKLVARPIWGGRANMDEYEAESPTGHLDGMTVRTYNAKSHQWSIYWATPKAGGFVLPATIGKFQNGIGEFYDHEDWNGQFIFVRYTWTATNPDSPRWEQAFSTDGGKTWETNWIMTYTREKD